jgi:TRAP-type mannitol/chloroaromatic compound transport system permease small subunit
MSHPDLSHPDLPSPVRTSALHRVADRIDRLGAATGKVAAWCVVAMVSVQFAIILMRFVFGAGSLWLQESMSYFHTALILFAAAWTLKDDGHVRVDVFYANAAPRAKAWIDLAGALLLLMPFMIAVIWLSMPYVIRGWRTLEGSREMSGLPLVFLLKTAIPVFAVLMLLQGVSQALRSLLFLRSHASGAEAS